jgi:hypothetical protein
LANSTSIIAVDAQQVAPQAITGVEEMKAAVKNHYRWTLEHLEGIVSDVKKYAEVDEPDRETDKADPFECFGKSSIDLQMCDEIFEQAMDIKDWGM